MYKKLKITLISATIILSSLYIVNAEDLLQDGINHSLNKLGETITSVLPGEGDTEITIHSQDNYDLRYSILAVRPLAMNPYSKISASEKRLVETGNVELHAHMQGSGGLVHQKDIYCDKSALNAY